MIDKNDVKMPVQNEDSNSAERTKEQEMERIQKVEDLLDLVNAVDNRQELRLDETYYNKFHWFGISNTNRDGKSYFSYQEEAVYDFIFNLNKSGILSDQVGMGKTIEAGMIISELASRNELRSLLIVVPNEIMAAKWEYELEHKFGVKTWPYNNRTFPSVKTLLSYEDFCRCVFDCVSKEKFSTLATHEFKHRYNEAEHHNYTLAQLMESFVKNDIKDAVRMINEGFINSEMDGDPQVEFDGKRFHITGTNFYQDYVYDANGNIAKFVAEQSKQRIDQVINGSFFQTKRYNPIIAKELNSLYTLVGEYFTTLPEEIASVAEGMTVSFPILIVPNTYSERKEKEILTHDFLNRILAAKIKNYKHKYIIKDKEGNISENFEDYRIIDFFIDVGYQTLIVDEVHDYIDVYAKVSREAFHKNAEQFEEDYPSRDFNRYELFDDYYFIKKKSLYKKLKALADKANRKIFLTATPIKSDMVDFYLLTLIASNKDADAYKKIRDYLDSAFPRNEDREAAIEKLYGIFNDCLREFSAHNFCNSPDKYLRLETDTDNSSKIPERDRRYLYPYFKNSFLQENVKNEELIKEYLLSQLNYMSVEEVILELILSYSAEMKGTKGENATIKKMLDDIGNLLCNEENSFVQTRIVFRTLLNNTIKQRFERDFTEVKYKIGDKVLSESELDAELKEQIDRVVKEEPLKQIRQLLELKDGPRRWHKTYRTYGIRHTRHETFNLGDCTDLQKLSKNKVERYNNLPYWPRRNGKIIFLLRDDCFFDSFLDVRRQLYEIGETPIEAGDLPNFDKMLGTQAEKMKRFEDAVNIFNYINDSMSGGMNDTHEPQSSRYESVDLDDSGMVDYKLALVNKLMLGRESALGSLSKKVLLFAEKDRDAILEWFRYQKCRPLYKKGEELDEKKLAEYRRKWQSYNVDPIGDDWSVSDNTDDMEKTVGNLLVVIDPSRYEKGVDLQKAETIINFDINYDPLKMEQRIGRIDRIRPLGQSREINIISFVPFNDMSGFVINFFANEMKMFTQWMGETTGIVSVLEDSDSGKSSDVSFGGKVDSLEKYYKDIYNLCRKPMGEDAQIALAKDFRKFFGPIIDQLGKDMAGKTPANATEKEIAELIHAFGAREEKTRVDFGFLQALRESFDKAFRNSISPQRLGYALSGYENKRVMRFNSSYGVFSPCATKTTCANCPDRDICGASGKVKRNSLAEFKSAVGKFFREGEAYYENCRRRYSDNGNIIHGQEGDSGLLKLLRDRKELFAKTRERVFSLLPEDTQEPFTMPYEKFLEIFEPMKKLFWDDVVDVYIRLILLVFHQQCDNVLQGAKLFERFIKIFSIAEFMNNMEGDI